MASVLVLGGLALIVGGIAATARGEREFHHHDHDHDKEHGDDNHVEGDAEHSAPALDAPVVIK